MARDRATTSAMMHMSLKGQPTGGLGRIVDRARVEDLLKISRPRFDKLAVWLVSALETEQITIDGRAALKDAFQEFRMAGGVKLVLAATNTTIASAIKLQARLAGINDITVVDTVKAASKIGSEFWDKHHPKPPPPTSVPPK